MLEFIPYLDTKWALWSSFLGYPGVQNRIIWIAEFPQMEVEDLELQVVHSDSLSLDGMSLFCESVTYRK